MDSTYPLLSRSHPKITPANKFWVVLFLLLVGCLSYGRIYSYWAVPNVEGLVNNELMIGTSAAQVEAALTRHGLDFIYNEKDLCYRAETSYRPFPGGMKTYYLIAVHMSKDRKVVSCTVTKRILI